MKNELIVLLGLIALSSPVTAQSDQQPKKRRRTIPTSSLDEQLEAKSKTGDETEEDKSRTRTKGESQMGRSGNQSEKGALWSASRGMRVKLLP